jgi:hypothetical protein
MYNARDVGPLVDIWVSEFSVRVSHCTLCDVEESLIGHSLLSPRALSSDTAERIILNTTWETVLFDTGLFTVPFC